MASERKQVVVSNLERDFILQALREDKRVDGRRPFDFRTLKISFGPERGNTEVKLGETRVYVVVTAEAIEPFPDRPTEGFYNFNTEFSPMASPTFESGRQSEMAVELGRVVERGLRESRAIDTEALCIVAGRKVWSVRVDIHILDHGGNLQDAASIATVAALSHFRRPDVTVAGDQIVIHSVRDREPIPLSIHHTPISVTFGLFADGELMVLDPNLREEAVMEGRLTITMNYHKEVCAVQKAGGTPLAIGTLIECTKIAAGKVTELHQVLQQALKASEKKLVQPHQIGAPFDASIQVAAAAPLSSTQPVKTTATVVESAAPATPAAKKTKKPDSPFLVPASGERFFEGGASAWGTDDHSAALDKGAQQELSALTNKLLSEMEERVNEIHVSTRAEAANEVPKPAELDDSKRRKKQTEEKKTQPEESSEEEPVTLTSPSQVTPVPAASPAKAKPKPKKPADDGDLSVALKKPPAKKKAK